jgi:uncharacterized membrane protein
MGSLSQKTEDWVAGGIITPEQAGSILSYEKQRPRLMTPSAVFIFLGVLALGCGLCALVASNWRDIPDSVKLGGMFLLLIGGAGGLCALQNKKPTAFEAGIVLYALSFFAAIGLVGQVFHIRSDAYKAFLFWSALSLPLLFLTKRAVLAYVWLPVAFFSFMASPWGHEIWRWFHSLPVPPFLFVSFLFFAVYVVLFAYRKKIAVSAAASLFFYSALGFMWPLVFIRGRHVISSDTSLLLLFLCILAFLCVVKFVLPLTPRVKKSIFGTGGVYFLAALIVPAGPLVFFLFSLLILAALCVFAYETESRRLFNGMTAVFIFRILWTFFDLFGSLMMTGFGLILSGVLIITAAVAWKKVRRLAAARMKKENAS